MAVAPSLFDASDPLEVLESREIGHPQMIEIDRQDMNRNRCSRLSDRLYCESLLRRSS